MTRTYFFSAKKYAKNSSLKTFDTEDVHPSTIVKNFVGDRIRECRDYAFFSTPLQSGLMSPVKILTLALGGTNVWSECSSDKAWTLGRYQVSRPSGMEDKENLITTIANITLQSGLMSPLKQFFYDDLLAYGIKGRKATNSSSLRLAQSRPFYWDNISSPLQSGLRSPVKILTLALGGTNVWSECSSDEAWTLGRYQVSRPSGMEDKENLIATIANITLQSGLRSPVKILTLALGGTNVRSECSSDKAWTLGRYQVSRPSGMEDKENLITTIANITLQSRLRSPVKQFFYDDLLVYGIKGRKATNSSSLRLAQSRPFYWDNISSPLQSGLRSPVKILTLALGCTNVWSECSSDEFWTLLRSKVSRPSGMEDKENLITIIANITLQSRLMSPVKILTLALGGTNVWSECSSDKAWTLGRYQVSRLSGMEDKRNLITTIASAELGTKEATGNNDGHRVEQYLRYTNLGPGHDWCAAFVSWVYSQAGLSRPCNPWSPALFPKARSYRNAEQIQQADLFSIYSSKLKRIHHVGLIKEKQGQYILTIEGNSNDSVESRRRHQRTVYSYANWID